MEKVTIKSIKSLGDFQTPYRWEVEPDGFNESDKELFNLCVLKARLDFSSHTLALTLINPEHIDLSLLISRLCEKEFNTIKIYPLDKKNERLSECYSINGKIKEHNLDFDEGREDLFQRHKLLMKIDSLKFAEV